MKLNCLRLWASISKPDYNALAVWQMKETSKLAESFTWGHVIENSEQVSVAFRQPVYLQNQLLVWIMDNWIFPLYFDLVSPSDIILGKSNTRKKKKWAILHSFGPKAKVVDGLHEWVESVLLLTHIFPVVWTRPTKYSSIKLQRKSWTTRSFTWNLNTLEVKNGSKHKIADSLPSFVLC